MVSGMLSDCLKGKSAEAKQEKVTGKPLSEQLLKMEEGSRHPCDLKVKSKRDMYLKWSAEPAVDSEMPKLSELQEQLSKIQDIQDVQVKTIQRLRRRSMILVALVLLLMLALSAVTYLGYASLSSERSQRFAGDAKNVASQAETEQSKLEQTIAAVTQRMDQQHSDWSKAIATVNHNVHAESSARAQAIAAVKKDLNASVYSESSNSMQAIAAISDRMEQEHSDWAKAVDAESSTRAQDIEAIRKQVDKEHTDQGEAMAGLSQRIHITQAKIQGGMCSYCFSCGGQWPVFMGEITEAVKDMKRRGSECGGDLASDGHGMRKNSFCCATV